MKTLGLCLLSLSILGSVAPAQVVLSAPPQDASLTPTFNPDIDALRKWWLTQTGADWSRPQRDQEFVSSGAEESSCAFMRTYRMERKSRGSDEVRPAGYTTCVPIKRFETRNAVLQLSPQ
jgi:hypothetical protein